MPGPLWTLKAELLQDGESLTLDAAAVDRVRAALPADGPPSDDDLHALVAMRTEARVVCSEFDAVLFPALKAALLSDGKIDPAERFLLLRMLYGGGGIDDREWQFLQELRAEATVPSEDFETLYQQVKRDYTPPAAPAG